MAPKASGPRKRPGTRSIRTRVLMIGWLPSLSLLLVGVVVASILAVNFWNERSTNSTLRDTLTPIQSFLPEARSELLLSAAYITEPTVASATRLKAQQARTNQTLRTIQAEVNSFSGAQPEAIKQAVASFSTRLGQIQPLRNRIDDGEATPLEATQFWGGLIDQIANTVRLRATIAPTGETAIEERRGADLIGLVQSMAEGNALAYVAVSGQGVTPEEYQTFVKTGDTYRDQLATITPDLTPSEQQQVKTLTSSPGWRQQAQVEQAVLVAHVLTLGEKKDLTAARKANSGNPSSSNSDGPYTPVDRGPGRLPFGGLTLPGTPATNAELNNGNLKAELPIRTLAWENADDTVTGALIALAVDHLNYASDLAVDASTTRFRSSIYAGVAALLFGILIFLITTREGNRLAGRLRGLRDETLDLAQTRLPALVQGLRVGEVNDELRQMPRLSFGQDEIGEVADAFNQAQEVAVTAAVQEAETRAGLREVFLNIAYRSQVIVHRQLGVLEKAERYEEDPGQIELLFELDHLATRARRNAENLVILGGGQPGRRWRNSVDLLQVVRSSISEAQDYARVSVGRLPRLAINGTAVADVIHLLAELVDNATAFSPPMSKVEVRGNLVGKGLVLEIEDQGLGIPAEKLTELNEMLLNAPDFHALTLREEPRLGMFVVAQLAAGQNIRVTLTPSLAYGGTKAVVLVPSELFNAGPGSLSGDSSSAALEADGNGLETPAARSLHERMAIGGEMAGEITVLSPPAEPAPSAPVRRISAPALSVAPVEPRRPNDGERFDPPGDQSGKPGELWPRLTPMPPVRVASEPVPEPAPPRYSPSGFTPSGPDPRRGTGGSGEQPGPTVNPQARADFLTARGTAPGRNGNPGLPLRNPGGGSNGSNGSNGSPTGNGATGVGRTAPTPPSGLRGGPAPRPRATGPEGRPELPRRTRQAHLSDRLRSAPAPDTGTLPERPHGGATGDPELARNRMAAFQRGTQRGRTEQPDA